MKKLMMVNKLNIINIKEIIGLLSDWQYEAMLYQEFQAYRSSPVLLLEKLKKFFIVKNRELFENLKKNAMFLFSFKILKEDNNIEKTIINGLLFSFYLCLKNCLNQIPNEQFFYVESLNLLPDYRGNGKFL